MSDHVDSNGRILTGVEAYNAGRLRGALDMIELCGPDALVDLWIAALRANPELTVKAFLKSED